MERFFQYFGIAVAIFVFMLFYFCCWIYRRFYSNLPSVSLESTYIYLASTGKIPKNISFSNYFFNQVTEVCNRYGKDGLILVWFLRPILFIFDEQYIKVLANEPDAVNKPSFGYDIFQEMLGKGLLTNNGELWRHRRKMFNPAFRFELLKNHVSIFNEGAKIMVKELSKISNRPTVEVLGILKIGSLKLLCESVLGIKLNDEKYNEKIERYLELLTSLAKHTMYRIPRPWMQFRWMQMLFPSGRKHWKSFKEFQTFTMDIIMDVKTSMTREVNEKRSESEDTYSNAKSFARILLENHQKDPSFTIEDLQTEVNHIIFAGHDTTAHAMLWCLFMLGHHPEIQEKAFQEVENVTGNDGNYCYADLRKLVYLENVIKETLRLYPAVPAHGRILKKHLTCGKYEIPKNTIIAFVPYLLHRTSSIYPDPEKFDPERFAKSTPTHPWAYVPFSEGIRSCIGKKFAMMEMKVILAYILRNFRITSLDKKEDIGFNWDLVLTPSKDINFCLTSRQPISLLRG